MRFVRTLCTLCTLRTVLVVLTLVSGWALAQEETFISRTFDASGFIETLQDEAEVYNETLTDIGRALAALGLVASVVMAIVKGSLHATAETFLRALVVSGLLVLTPSISDLTYTTWDNVRAWSMNRLQGSFDEGATELAQLGILAVHELSTQTKALLSVAHGALRRERNHEQASVHPATAESTGSGLRDNPSDALEPYAERSS